MNEQTSSRPYPPASEGMDAACAALEAALTRTKDALSGFETMVEKAEPEFRPIAERFRTLHARHVTALSQMLSDAGRTPDTDGSLMGTVNQAVVATRAFLDKIDADVLAQVIRGEEHVIEAYRDALAKPVPSPARDTLSSLLTELQTLVAETRRAT